MKDPLGATDLVAFNLAGTEQAYDGIGVEAENEGTEWAGMDCRDDAGMAVKLFRCRSVSLFSGKRFRHP